MQSLSGYADSQGRLLSTHHIDGGLPQRPALNPNTNMRARTIFQQGPQGQESSFIM